MKRPPLIGNNIINFGKFKGLALSSPDIDTSYIRWFLSVETRTHYLEPWKAELDRRLGKPSRPQQAPFTPAAPATQPKPTTPTPAQLTPIAQKLLAYIKANLAGQPKSAVFPLFDTKQFGTYVETQKAWTEITRSGIKISKDGITFWFPDAPPKQDQGDESPGTIYTKDIVTEFLIDAYDRGYKQALDILQPRIKALDEGEFIKGRLRNSLKQEAMKPPDKSDVTVLLTKDQLQELILQSVSLGYSDAFEKLANRIHAFHYSDLDNDALYKFLILGTGSANVTPKEDQDPMDRKAGKKWWHSEDRRKSFRN